MHLLVSRISGRNLLFSISVLFENPKSLYLPEVKRPAILTGMLSFKWYSILTVIHNHQGADNNFVFKW